MNIKQIKIIHEGSSPAFERELNKWLTEMSKQDVIVEKISYTHTQAPMGASFVAYIEYH